MVMVYDERFFAENAVVALAGAKAILPQVIADTNAKTVIDVGCGSAAWAMVAQELGCDIRCVDGYAPEGLLLVDPSCFVRRDLTQGVPCGDADLAICLEVIEHLPASAEATLIAGLCEARYVLFSGAHPGQRGVNHINEAWSTHWAAIFNRYGYVGSCDIRDRHWEDDTIEWFYRENIMLFSTSERLDAIGYAQGVRNDVHPRRP